MKSKVSFALCALAFVAYTSTGAVAVNIVTNGSFETPLVSSLGTNPNGVEIGSPFNLGGWTVDRNSIDLFAAAGYYEVSDGIQAVFLSGGNAGSIFQDLVTTPGLSYVLRFAMSGDPGKPGWPLIKNMEVMWGASVVDTPTFDITTTTPDAMGWQYLEYNLVATEAVTRLRFSSLDFDPTGPALDNVSVVASAVPESSSSMVLLLIGIASVTCMRGRLKR